MGGGGGAEADGGAPIVIAGVGQVAGSVGDDDLRIGQGSGKAEGGEGGAGGADEELAVAGAGCDDDAGDHDVGAGADGTAAGDVDQFRARATDFVDLGDGEAGGAADAADLCGVGTGGERGDDDGVFAVGGESEGSGCGHRGSIGCAPVVIGGDRGLGGGVDQRQERIREEARETEGREGRPNGADDDLFVRAGPDDETGGEHFGTGAGLAASREIGEAGFLGREGGGASEGEGPKHERTEGLRIHGIEMKRAENGRPKNGSVRKRG